LNPSHKILHICYERRVIKKMCTLAIRHDYQDDAAFIASVRVDLLGRFVVQPVLRTSSDTTTKLENGP